VPILPLLLKVLDENRSEPEMPSNWVVSEMLKTLERQRQEASNALTEPLNIIVSALYTTTRKRFLSSKKTTTWSVKIAPDKPHMIHSINLNLTPPGYGYAGPYSQEFTDLEGPVEYIIPISEGKYQPQTADSYTARVRIALKRGYEWRMRPGPVFKVDYNLNQITCAFECTLERKAYEKSFALTVHANSRVLIGHDR
jgi:hypothetical protein